MCGLSHLHAFSPVFILSHVLLVVSPPALTLAQVGSFSLAAPRWRMFISAPSDLASYERCVRAPDKPHHFLVLLSRRASCNSGIRIDRHVDYEIVSSSSLCRI